jgi:transposase
MAQRRLTLRKTKEVLRLKWGLGLSARQVGASLNISHSTVGEYIKRAERAGLDWTQAKDLSEAAITAQLYPPQKPKQKRPEPDWPEVKKELRQKGVTRMLLWQEYLEEYPDGYSYSQFCERYRQWQEGAEETSMRKPKKAGEEVEVDYAGLTVTVTNPETGETHEMQVFVGVLGASGYIYCEAHRSQSSPNWIRAHVRMFEFFGGVPKIERPDNLKAGVKSPCFYEPDLNPTYHELAQHYHLAVIPTRVAKPKDKGLGENAVQQVERWVLAPLRKERFFSLHDLNQALWKRLKWLNERPLSHQPHSRRSLFEAIEKEALQPLPTYPFDFLEVKRAKVNIDYHVTFKRHHYSVPHTYARQSVEIRASERLVEIFPLGKKAPTDRIACHVRCDHQPGYSTQAAHMPDNHRWKLEWSPDRFASWAGKIGPQTEALIRKLLVSRSHPEQSYRACLGVLNLAKKHPAKTLEAACQLALDHDLISYRAVKNLLTTKKDMLDMEEKVQPQSHEHIRGQTYYI